MSQAGGDKGAAEKQPEIKKLQKQRLKILVKIAEVQTQLAQEARFDFGKATQAHRNVLLAIVEIADTPEERLTALRDLKKLTANLLKITEDRLKGGTGRQVDLFEAQALVLEAQIELLKEEAKVKPKNK